VQRAGHRLRRQRRLQQRKGRFILRGFWGTGEMSCEPPETTWSSTAQANNGLFAGGSATLRNVFTSGCAEFSCDEVFIEGLEIKLAGQGKKP
jgi:hypothetical protein